MHMHVYNVHTCVGVHVYTHTRRNYLEGEKKNEKECYTKHSIMHACTNTHTVVSITKFKPHRPTLQTHRQVQYSKRAPSTDMRVSMTRIELVLQCLSIDALGASLKAEK